MKRIKINDVETFIAAVQDEISHTPEGRYYHRLHVVLHALKTGSFYKTASIYDHSVHSIYNWVDRLTTHGLVGLREGEHPGRPSRLSPTHEEKIRKHLLLSPRKFSYDQNIWDGPLLSHHLEKQFSIYLKVRQCQNLFHKLGFTLQRPRRQASNSNPKQQEEFKKNSKSG